MKKIISNKKSNLILSIAMSSLIVLTIGVSSFAYWTKEQGTFNIPTTGFNATEDEFTYYACVPNVSSKHGYDYYDITSIPSDLTDRVTGLAVVRFEALTKTCYIPAYPSVAIDGIKYNNAGAKELPVIHILNSLSYDDISIDNGFSKVETLIIPETISFIQEGSFATSNNLKEVSFLGTSSNSGYIWYNDEEFVKGGNQIDLHFESSHRHDLSLNYSLNNKENYLHTQFNDEFEYDNLNKSYYTFVVPNTKINQGTEIIDGVVSSKDMLPNIKYRLNYNGTTLTIDEYTYKLSYSGLANPIDLVLNTDVDYEEYILQDNMGTMRISNYPDIFVDEYINGELNKKAKSEFSLSLLNANYSSDNNAFEIKYAPSYTYESIHYHTDSSNRLIDTKTLTQISVEKAYFLNEVTSTDLEVNGERVKTITVPDDGYLKLYVRAKYKDGTNFENEYFVDPKDSTGQNVYVEMSKNGDSWTYQFSSNNAPEAVLNEYGSVDSLKEYLVPNSFTFYTGKQNVISYPSYVASDANESDLKTTLENANYNTTRVYLDTTFESGLFEDDHYGEDGLIKYHWYLVYWDDEGKQGSFRVYFADYNSSYLIADVPNIAHHFKFARIDASSKIDAALANDWKGVQNQIELDGITLKQENTVAGKINYLDIANGYNLIKWKEWYTNNNGHFTYDINLNDTFKVTDTKLLLRNRNYLVVENYGQKDNVKYIPIDENLGYDRKDISSTINKLEFTKYSDYERRYIQSIALSEGSIVKAKVFNINTAEYFDGYFGKSDVTGNDALGFLVHNSNGIEVPTSDYFEFDQNGYLIVKKDCQVEFFLKINYSSTTKDIVDYGWYFKVISDTLPGFNREVVVDTSIEYTGTTQNTSNPTSMYYDSNTKTFDITYPLLEQTGTVYKLTRNYSNTGYEEYYYHTDSSSTIDNRSFVVSPYYENDRDFAANTGNIYYSVISGTSTGEVTVPNNYDLVLFTPNDSSGYERKYYAVFDEYDNLLTYLSNNQTQSVNEGYQCFSFIIPQAINDYKEIYIYEVDANGNIINKENGHLNSETNLDKIRIMYNNTNNTQIQYEKNEFIFDYYLQIEGKYEYNSNNLGFSFAEVDGDYSVYYFDNLYINSEIGYRIYDNYSSTSVNIALSNVSNKLDEQIIDGYYYTGLTLASGNTMFTLQSGYYDLCLRVNNGNYYLGYKYLGQENIYEENYYLHLYENGNEVKVIKMNSSINSNTYTVDVVVSKEYTYKIYDSVNMFVDGTEGTLTYSNKGINVGRIYFSNDYPFVVDEENSKVLVQTINGIELIYNFGNHPTMYNSEYVNIRYSPVMYVPTSDYFVNKIVIKNITNPVLNVLDDEDNIIRSQYFETITEVRYGSYLVVTDFNVNVQIKIGNTIKGTITIPQPGKYYVYYYVGTEKTDPVISCNKVQDADRFFVTLDGIVISTLDVSSTTNDYYEYVVKDHIILYEDIVLEGENSNILKVQDNLGNTITSIERVTVNSQSVTTIPAGVYSLTYSVDSSRRVEDKYLVFTYLNFNTIDSSTITYHYEISEGETSSTIKNAVTSLNGNNWYYTLEVYKSLTSYVPKGQYFAGWTTIEGGKNVEFEDGEIITLSDDIELYPVFKNRSSKQQVIWLSDLKFDSTSDIVFTLDNLDNSNIVSVSYEEMDISSYVEVSNNRVYVNPSLFEKIGYIEGGIPLLVHLVSTIDEDTYSTEVLVSYPKYQNSDSSTVSYSSKFSSNEYEISSSTSVKTEIITSIIENSISWDLVDANITTVNAHPTEEDAKDMSLRLKAGGAGLSVGKATTGTMFTKLIDISFDMWTKEFYEDTELRIVLLDASGNELYRSSPIKNTIDSEYEHFTVSFEVSGVYFVRLEAKTIHASQTFVHIDNISFATGLRNYATNFTTDEYTYLSDSWHNGEEYVIQGNGSYLSWKSLDAKLERDNSIDPSNENDLAIALRKNKAAGEDGYVISTQKFSNIQTVSLKMMHKGAVTKIFIRVSIVDENGVVLAATDDQKAAVQGEWTNDLLYTFNYSDSGYLKISIYVNNPGESTTYTAYIDNLVVTCE